MDFTEIKAIRIVDVCLRYGISLKYRGEWASGNCPLPSHDSKSKGTFAVNVKENYWVCHSESCRAKSGKRGGDVISFVALKEGITDKAAAEKLAQWFNIKKEASHMETPVPEVKKQPQRTHQNPSTSSDSGKGYMHELKLRMDEVIKRGEQEAEPDYLSRLAKWFMSEIHLSFRNGKRAQQGLPPLAS
jgi:hypothetical protein